MKRRFSLLIVIFILVSLACQFSPTAQATPTKAREPTKVKPTEIQPPADKPTPVEEKPVEPKQENKDTQEKPSVEDKKETSAESYHEEFDTDSQNIEEFVQKYTNWKDQSDELFPFIVAGNGKKDAQLFTEGGQLVVKLGGYEETHMKLYENKHLFKDVVVSTEFENFGATRNKVGLLCKVNKMGWYEFQINNEGYYWIYRYDTALKTAGKNPYIMILDERASTLIKTGNKKNTFSLTCTDDKFTFTINDKELTADKMSIPQVKMSEFKKYANKEGSTGLAFYSWQNTAGNVEVRFEYFDAKAP